MARNDPQVNFRIPADLKQALEAAALKNNRSFKAEIEFRLSSWDDAIEQIDLAHEGWDQARTKVESQSEQINGLIAELEELNSRQEMLEDRLGEIRVAAAEAERLERHWRDEAERLRSEGNTLRSELATIKATAKTQLGEDQQRVLKLALDTLESSVEDQKRTLRQERYMLAQLRLMRGLLNRVGAGGQSIPDDLLMTIRILTESEGTVRPEDVDVSALLTDVVRSIETLEAHGEWDDKPRPTVRQLVEAMSRQMEIDPAPLLAVLPKTVVESMIARLAEDPGWGDMPLSFDK